MKRGRPPLSGATSAELLEAGYQAHIHGREAEAEALYRRVLTAPPAEHGMAPAWLAVICLYQGDRLYGQGRAAEAIERYDEALALTPRADVYNNRGVALEALGRLEEALQSFSQAAVCRSDYAPAFFNRAGVLSALGYWAEALADYDRAVGLLPDHYPHCWNNRGLALGELNRWAEAAESFSKALALDPAYTGAAANLSVAQRRLGQLDAALQSADRALALQPDHPEALTTRGLALAALGRFEAALESHERALALRPAYPQALNNAGVALEALDRVDEAVARFDAALALDRGFAEAEFNSALALLRAGQWSQGWRRHEARWRRKGEPGPTYAHESLWLGGSGDEGLKGRTILLHAEQGLGDTLQFCRYASAVKTLGARVILEVQPPLKTLLSGLAGVDQVIAIGEALPPCDRQTPLLSLPLALGAGSDIPGAPYLVADPAREIVWRDRLPPARGPRIGLVWAGSSAHGNDRNRSISAQALAPVISAARSLGAQTISLQKEVRASDLAWLEQAPEILRVEDRLTDFAETAALISICDLVISVDTSVAHLAGALGRPLWLLIPKPCDWRWMSDREDTPWYPGARLFRQAAPGDWTGALDRMAQALAEFRAA